MTPLGRRRARGGTGAAPGTPAEPGGPAGSPDRSGTARPGEDGPVGAARGTGSDVRDLLHRAMVAYADDPAAVAVLQGELERLDAPLQVALAGKLKAGKSTLLNALLGVELAASDHGECTRVVTWYRWAQTPSVTVHPVDGAAWSSPPRRGPHGLEVDLRGHGAPEIDRIEVGWPAPGLRRTTLVDTPGLDSLSRDVSERTRTFLMHDDGGVAVDAVVYLMRHLHATDVRFLESFGAGRSGRGVAPGTVAVLSRADEVGVGRIDAMIAAGRVGERYRGEASLRPLVQTVVPVAGLLALTGQTLREDEVADLRALAGLDRTVTEGLLLSVDRFRRPSMELPVTAPARAALLSRFGIFGVRLALALLRGRDLPTPALAAELERRSGLTELRRVLDAQLTARRDTLRSQAAVRRLTTLLAEHPVPDGPALEARCERLMLAAHGVRELELLGTLRAHGLGLAPDALAAAERLLGAQGDRATDRLALPPDADPQEVADAARAALDLWRARGEDPLADRETRRACRALQRTCEELLEPVSAGAPAHV